MPVLIDVDNTIAAVNIELVRKFNISLIEYPSRGIPPDFFTSPEGAKLLWNAEAFPYSLTAVWRLYKSGVDIYYVSSRMKELYFLTEKWLKKWNFPPGETVVGLTCKQKANLAKELKASACFEDDPRAVAEIFETGVTIWMKDWPYNARVYGENILRFKSWAEIAQTTVGLVNQE